MKTNTETAARTSKELLDELHTLVAEVEKLANEPANEQTADILGRLRERYDAAQESLAGLCACAKKKVAAGAHCADEAIRSHPYQSLAIAVGAGLLAGVLMGRRSK
ncbi:DUF883 domain-containing protein [Opitutaceae bacterium TAV4]|uniref:DUF883 family protein n=1 Tax=Geminisphaera colitermitum TaxID=1148786 RepID=UPI00030A8273|nr:DUF883 family protein [Geminisphaera colitermitum]RRJ96917.1 DUF883 domain-containing protein [Opitutaceae bacterium TAV4]RRK00857.1 DUF883 domain-containing protein [Opitutaceae bacterium TAV3]